jgi:hypothetical protein
MCELSDQECCDISRARDWYDDIAGLFIHLGLIRVHFMPRNRFGGLVRSCCNEYCTGVRECFAAVIKASLLSSRTYSLYLSVRSTPVLLTKSQQQPQLLSSLILKIKK